MIRKFNKKLEELRNGFKLIYDRKQKYQNLNSAMPESGRMNLEKVDLRKMFDMKFNNFIRSDLLMVSFVREKKMK